mgnify:CR=1 FL=1
MMRSEVMIPSRKIDSGKCCAKYFLRSPQVCWSKRVRCNVFLKLGMDAKPAPVRIEHLVIAGWTGRDKRAVQGTSANSEVLGEAPLITPFFTASP